MRSINRRYSPAGLETLQAQQKHRCQAGRHFVPRKAQLWAASRKHHARLPAHMCMQAHMLSVKDLHRASEMCFYVIRAKLLPEGKHHTRGLCRRFTQANMRTIAQ